MTKISIIVPLEPPSVNGYVRHTRSGKHYKTPEAKAFLEAVAIFARGQQVRAEAYRLTMCVYQGKGSKGDVDNYCKVPIDSLVAAGVIHSDAAITDLHISKRRDWRSPRTVIVVEAL